MNNPEIDKCNSELLNLKKSYNTLKDDYAKLMNERTPKSQEDTMANVQATNNAVKLPIINFVDLKPLKKTKSINLTTQSSIIPSQEQPVTPTPFNQLSNLRKTNFDLTRGGKKRTNKKNIHSKNKKGGGGSRNSKKRKHKKSLKRN